MENTYTFPATGREAVVVKCKEVHQQEVVTGAPAAIQAAKEQISFLQTLCQGRSLWLGGEGGVVWWL